MGKVFDFNKFFRSKHPYKTFGLSKEQVFVARTCLSYLCTINPDINPSYFDATRTCEELLNGDKKKFELLFCNLVDRFDLYSVITLEELPKKMEFELFPTFIDLVMYFVEKCEMKN